MNIQTIILAAGQGTRMRSNKPKVLHKLANKAMLSHVIDACAELQPVKQFIVVGYQAEQVRAEITADNIQWVIQNEQLGTGHAVAQVLPHLANAGISIIVYADVPLISTQTLDLLRQQVVSDAAMALVTQRVQDPTGYGRIVRDEDNKICAIVEQKDASLEQQSIKEINTGIMAVRNSDLQRWLPQLNNANAQGEYYLTDIIALAVKDGIAINSVHATHDYEVQGVNSKLQLAQLERIYQGELAHKLMADGVQLIDPARIDVRGELTAGRDCLIDVNCVFEGQVHLGDNVHIEANCIIKDADIASGVHIKAHSIIEQSRVGEQVVLGPFARLRPGTQLDKYVHIGNFVEVKNACIGAGSKVNHLTYIGDTVMGEGCNIGAGTITCNYDGANKHQTTIGHRVFIGSNNSLVAPVSIGDGATTAAGTTVRKAVQEGALCLTEGRQKSVANWKRPVKRKE